MTDVFQNFLIRFIYRFIVELDKIAKEAVISIDFFDSIIFRHQSDFKYCQSLVLIREHNIYHYTDDEVDNLIFDDLRSGVTYLNTPRDKCDHLVIDDQVLKFISLRLASFFKDMAIYISNAFLSDMKKKVIDKAFINMMLRNLMYTYDIDINLLINDYGL
jgi:hypothetical protein